MPANSAALRSATLTDAVLSIVGAGEHAVEPATGKAFSLVLPLCRRRDMSLFLAHFARTIEDGVHVVMVLDGASWHGEKAIDLPANITLVTLPPYSPELNPVERLWMFLRERFLSLRIFRDRDHIINA